MGFRTGSYCTVWSVETISNTNTKARISISRKNKNTGEYETDFSGFVNFIGSAAASKAASLKERDRIKLGDVDVTNRFDKEKNVLYTNYKVFSFEQPDAPERTDAPVSANNMAVIEENEQEDGFPF